jgi:hypothetical protein
MKINSRTQVIEMTKKFAKAAARFGSEEYNQLQQARRDYPNFKVVTVSRKAPTQKDSYKGLTYSYMEAYIKAHDDAQQSIMAEYEMLRGLSDEAKEALAEACSYLEMKEWFLKKFPAIAEFHKKREALLAA